MSESTSRSSSAISSLASSLTGIGLFLLTTALSQWIQASKRTKDETADEFTTHSQNDLSSPYNDDTNFRQLYHSRRLADRMSYENLPESFSIPAAVSQEEFQYSQGDPQAIHPSIEGTIPYDNVNLELSSGMVLTEWNMLQQQRKSIAAALQERRQQQQQNNKAEAMISNCKDEYSWTPEVHPNAYHDFHPKNRNWRHFEHYNDHDRRRREKKLMLEKTMASQPSDAACPPNKIPPPNDSADPATKATTTTTTCSGGKDRINQFQYHRSASSDISGMTAISDNPITDDDDDNDAQSISSSSVSEEEQFVWTKHKHNSSSIRSVSHLPDILQRKSGHVLKDVSTSQPVMTNPPDSTQPLQDVTHNPPDSIQPSQGVTHNIQKLPPRPLQAFRRFFSWDATQEKRVEENNDRENLELYHPNPLLIRSTTLEGYNRRIRAEYNARIMPKKLVLIRHGQSMGNVNEVLYSTTPDNAMPLTRLGWEQARYAGTILRDKILAPGETIHFIVSPYVRTVETFHGMVSAWCDPMSPEFASISNHDEKVKAWYGQLIELGLTWNEDSRLREQDFGNYQNPEVIKRAKEERHRFGAFYYRFPHGESASDVFDRVSTFLDSLWRSFEMNKSRNYVLVTHGIVLRVLLARYFRYTIDQFNILANPRNCEMVVLGHSGDGKLDLEGRCELDIDTMNNNNDNNEPRVTGYKFHKRLRILPKSAIRKVKIRISPND